MIFRDMIYDTDMIYDYGKTNTNTALSPRLMILHTAQRAKSFYEVPGPYHIFNILPFRYVAYTEWFLSIELTADKIPDNIYENS